MGIPEHGATPLDERPADDLPRLWHFIVAYLLLSAGLYLTIPLLLGVNSGRELRMLCIIAGGICLGQLGYIAVMGPSKDFVPMRPWRLILSAILTAAVLMLLMFAAFLWIGAIISQYVAGGIGHIGLVVLATAVVVAPLSLVVLLCHGCISQDRFIVFGRMLACILVVGVIEGVFSLAATLSYYIWRIWNEDDIWPLFHGDTAMGPTIGTFLIVFVLAWSVGPLTVWQYYRRLRLACRN